MDAAIKIPSTTLLFRQALTEIRDLRSKGDTHHAELSAKADALGDLSRSLDATREERLLAEERLQASVEHAERLETRSAQLEAEIAALNREIDTLKAVHEEDKETMRRADAQRLADAQREVLESVARAAVVLLEQSQEDLQNATSITYPPRKCD